MRRPVSFSTTLRVLAVSLLMQMESWSNIRSSMGMTSLFSISTRVAPVTRPLVAPVSMTTGVWGASKRSS